MIYHEPKSVYSGGACAGILKAVLIRVCPNLTVKTFYIRLELPILPYAINSKLILWIKARIYICMN